MQISTGLSVQLQKFLDLSSEQLKLTASNMANVSTPGYTKQEVVWQEATPVEIGSRLIGTGVTDAGTVSQRDRVLNQAVDQQSQAQAATSARLGALNDVQSVFAAATSATGSATTSDISAGISSFFGSFEQLEAMPSDPSSRQAVLASANNLTDSFHLAASSLSQQQVSLDGQVSSVVTQVNSLSQSIATLNGQISSVSPHADAGALEDQRQSDLNSLATLVGIQQVRTENNGLMVTTTAGSVLVAGSQATGLSTGSSNGVTHIFNGSADITSALTSGDGQIGGLLQVRDQDIPSTMSSLDTLASSLGIAVNSANEGGTDANGATGTAFFSLPATVSGSAAGISVALTDPLTIAAAASGAGSGDGSNASTMAGLAQKSIINGQSASGFYATFVSSLGSLVSSVGANNTAREAALTQLQSQQSNLSTVSLDSEATNLQNLEQAYQAASKVFTIINTLVGAAIDLGVSTAV